MNKLSNSKNHIWSFPLLAGILTIIGLLTPSSALEENEIHWMWGLVYFNLFPIDTKFKWIFELSPSDFTPIIFICKIIPFFILLVIATFSITLALKLRKEGDFQKIERKWLFCGLSFIIISIFYLIEIEILMRYFYKEYAGLDMGYWENYTPGFAVIAPFISGTIILIGYYVNKYVLVPERRDLIIRVTKLYRNILFSFLIAIGLFIIGVSISFVIYKLLPGDPVVATLQAYGIFPFTQEQYEAMEKALGLDLHAILQYFIYLGNFFIGNWGISVSILPIAKVTGLIITATLRMIAFFILPLIVGLTAGILLGRTSYRYRGRWKDKLIQVLCISIISIPVFFFGMVLQYFFAFKWSIFNATGYVMPMYIMTLSIFALITWQTRSHMINKLYETSILLDTIKIAQTFGFLFMFYLLLDVTFGLGGLGNLLMDSIFQYEYFLITGLLSTLIIILVMVVLIFNLIFSYNTYREHEIVESNVKNQNYNIVHEINDNTQIESEESIKSYLLRRIKSPYTIIAVIIIAIFIFISIFPFAITEYTFEDCFRIYAGSWSSPSSDHPLGTAEFGRDVLALVVYGIRTSMVVGCGSVLIGLILGSPLGYVAGKYNRRAYKPMMVIAMFFYLFPGIIFVIFSLIIFKSSFLISMLVIGILLTPSFIQVIANAMSEDINIHRIIKKAICHIPLNFAFAILLYEALGFIGVGDGDIIELGKNINRARMNLYVAPWATLWPGLAIFGLVLSFLLLHVGLQGFDPKLRELEKSKIE